MSHLPPRSCDPLESALGRERCFQGRESLLQRTLLEGGDCLARQGRDRAVPALRQLFQRK